MSQDKEGKFYTPEEVAIKVLEKAREMLAKSEVLKKANTSHEVEGGEEPNNDDAECPEYLADADIEGAGEEKANKKKKDSEPAHEEGMSEDEEMAHDAAENEADEDDADKIEADEEPEAKEADAEIEQEDAGEEDSEEEAAEEEDDKEEAEKAVDKKKMDKSESKGINKLKNFLAKKEYKCEDKMKKAKNKKMEKFLGISPKDEPQRPEGKMKQMPMQPPQKGVGMKGY